MKPKKEIMIKCGLDVSAMEQVGNLFHYTNTFVAESIIKNRSIWMTSPQFSNDESEIVAAIELIDDVVSRRASDLPNYTLDMWSRIKGELFPFTFSFSYFENDQWDNLNQWKTYGDDGFGICLMFNIDKLRSAIIDMEGMLSLSPVVYGYDDQEKCVNNAIESVQMMMANGVFLQGEEHQSGSYALSDALKIMACLFKHSAFIDERECRLVLEQNHHMGTRLPVKTLTSGRLSKPYVDSSDLCNIEWRKNTTFNNRSGVTSDNYQPIGAIIGPSIIKELNFITFSKFLMPGKTVKSELPYISKQTR